MFSMYIYKNPDGRKGVKLARNVCKNSEKRKNFPLKIVEIPT